MLFSWMKYFNVLDTRSIFALAVNFNNNLAIGIWSTLAIVLLANLTYVGNETTTLYTNTDGTMLNFKAGAVYNIELN